MAREAMITRTIVSKEVKVLVLSLVTKEVSEELYLVPKKCSTNKKVLEYLSDGYGDEGIRFVEVLDSREVQRMYGITEVEFISLARELDPETRKAFDDKKDKEEE